VFAVEEGVVRYYVMGEREEEDSFELNFVYEINDTSIIKKSALERIATLGMGGSTLDADESEERRHCFTIGLLVPSSTVVKSRRQLIIDDLDVQKRNAIAN
jgi:hypothetical protein